MDMEKVTVEVEPLHIPFSNRVIGDLRLHILQSKLYDSLNKGRNILLNAPTGSGKTLTLLLAGVYGGAVGLYPNNTLLVNQRDSLLKIIVEKARVVRKAWICKYDLDTNGYISIDVDQSKLDGILNFIKGEKRIPLIMLEIERGSDLFSGYTHIALLTVSGATVESEEGVPKREALYRLVEKAYSFGNPYITALMTPDTFLLIYSGMYRDFEVVGKMVHSTLGLLSEGASSKRMEDLLRETGTASRASLGPIIGIRARLLEFPLFIDEFHLYGDYEKDALYTILKLNREIGGEEYPVVFSSATPAEDTMNELTKDLGIDYTEISYENTNGDGFRVSGRTVVDVIPVDVHGVRINAYYEVGDHVPRILIENYLDEIKEILKKGGRILVILDKICQVFKTAEEFLDIGIQPTCYSTIKHPGCVEDSNLIIGSNSVTQGVNISNIKLLALTGIGWEDAVQRFGRRGRDGEDSHVILFAPRGRIEEIADFNGKKLSYTSFRDEIIKKIYTDVTARSRDITKYYSDLHWNRRKLLYLASLASLTRVIGQHRMFLKLQQEIDRSYAKYLLKGFIFGEPDVYAYVMMFRRAGFNVRYRIEGHDDIQEADIGTLIRNVKIMGSDGDVLLVDPWNPPELSERTIVTLDAEGINESHLDRRIARLIYLISKYGASVRAGSYKIHPTSDVTLYIEKQSDEGYKLFLIQTGQAVEVNFGTTTKLAIFL